MIWPLSLFQHKSARKSSAPIPAPVPQPLAPPTLALGLNVHVLTPDAVAWCVRAGVRQVRTTIYAGYDLALYDAGLAAAQAAGLDVLAVVHGGGDPDGWVRQLVAGAARWPWLAWQLGNECEASVSPSDYVGLWRDAWFHAGNATRLVIAATGDGHPGAYLDALLSAPYHPHAAAVHAYGPPPALALQERAGQMGDVLARWGVVVPLWCTEFGLDPVESLRLQQSTPATYPLAARDAWQRVAETAPGLVERAYGYCLDSDVAFAIQGTPTAEWLARAQGRP